MRPALRMPVRAVLLAALIGTFALASVGEHVSSNLASVLLASPLSPRDVHAQDCSPLINVDAPSPNASVQGPTTFSGWAVDQRAASGGGISGVQIYVDNTPENGGSLLGVATQTPRADVDASRGISGTFGFTATIDLSPVPPGPHTFYIGATTACGVQFATILANVGTAQLTTPTVTPTGLPTTPSVPGTIVLPTPTIPAAPTLTPQTIPPPPNLAAVREDQLLLSDLGAGWEEQSDSPKEETTRDLFGVSRFYNNTVPTSPLLFSGSVIIVPLSGVQLSDANLTDLLNDFSSGSTLTALTMVSGPTIGSGSQWAWNQLRDNGQAADVYYVVFRAGGAAAELLLVGESGRIGPDDLAPMANIVASRLAANPVIRTP
ncbi:MAG: hypothetical protein QOF51_1766 [Chloroflexota bacterium]|nr:hypothetical protein [Chloroflexota bacterium]